MQLRIPRSDGCSAGELRSRFGADLLCIARFPKLPRLRIKIGSRPVHVLQNARWISARDSRPDGSSPDHGCQLRSTDQADWLFTTLDTFATSLPAAVISPVVVRRTPIEQESAKRTEFLSSHDHVAQFSLLPSVRIPSPKDQNSV
jgi:hypothetical protein